MAGTRQRKTGPPSLARLIAQELREAAPQRYFMTEYYGPDGEIVEAWEGHPIQPGEEEIAMLILTGTEYARPRTNWRKRGVVPSRGFHRSLWRE